MTARYSGSQEVGSGAVAELPYFAYGSNMHPDAMLAVCPGARAIGVARLNGRRLVFQGPVTCTTDDTGHIDGVLWSVPKPQLAQLDAWEHYPDLYLREEVDVVLGLNQAVAAFIYVMSSSHNLNRPAGPSPAYLDVVLEAACIWGIASVDIVAAARRAGDAGAAEPEAVPWGNEYWADLLRRSKHKHHCPEHRQ